MWWNRAVKVNGIACNDPAVDSCNWNYDIDADGDATSNALYGTVMYRATDRLSLDPACAARTTRSTTASMKATSRPTRCPAST